MPLQGSLHQLETLIQSYHPIISIETVEEERVVLHLRELAAQLGMALFEWSVTRGLCKSPDEKMLLKTNEPLMLLRHMQDLRIEGIFLLKDWTRHLDEALIQRQFKEVAMGFAGSRSTMVLTGDAIELPHGLAHLAIYHDLPLPGAVDLKEMLQGVLRDMQRRRAITIDIQPAELRQVIRVLGGLTLEQAKRALAFCVLEDGQLSAADIENILAHKAKLIREGGLLDFIPLEANRYQLGGFGRLKGWLERSKVGFTAAARQYNLSPPRGILLVGVQGCGKSLAAKVIAREWSMPLLKLDAGRLFDKFIGESEKNFRTAIQLAESMAPAVLWIDEIEKGLAPTSGNEADGGLSRRLFGSFLTWLQEKDKAVFVVATANDLFSLPPELTRKGRFDEIFFVDLPQPQERADIFRIHLSLRKQDVQHFDIDRLAAATAGFSGAEIEQMVVAAIYRALYEKTPLSTDILVEESRHCIPLSVSRREEVESLQTLARQRFVGVS